MKKTLILCIIFFILGFLTHALFFPEILSNGLTDISSIVIPNPTPASGSTTLDPLITKVTYDGTHFSRHNITIGFTRYVEIVNTGNSLMWLLSNSPDLTTTRGYGQSEALQMQGNKKGTYVVVDKNNPQEKLVITVK